MKKRITVILEINTDDKHMAADEFIERDLKSEIACASNFYDILSIEAVEIANQENPE